MSSFPRSVSPIRSPRRGYCRLLTATLLVSACLFGGRSATAQDKCSDLAALRLPDVRIVEAAVVEPGEQGNESGEAPHCRVEGVIGRETHFELLLPETWNGRFAMGGGGGFVGSIQNAARWSVHFGYATVGTDTGHKGPGTDASWALNQPERQINFGHLAVHRTAETPQGRSFGAAPCVPIRNAQSTTGRAIPTTQTASRARLHRKRRNCPRLRRC